MERIQYSNLDRLHPDDPRRVAIHEAGHAVFAVKNKLIIEFAKIGPGPEEGHVPPEHPPRDYDFNISKVQAKVWQQFYAAGSAAEHVVYGTARRHAMKEDAEYHSELTPTSGESSYDQSVLRAAAQLNRAELNSVADSLLHLCSLSPQQVCEIIEITPHWEL